jgi:hypothetical protein
MKKLEEKGNGLPSAESIGTPSEDAPQGNDSWQRIARIMGIQRRTGHQSIFMPCG